MSYNKVILMGNLTRDPETRVTPNGATICKIGLAVNRSFSTQSGEKREEVAFVDCDAFGKTAEVISKWMTKGREILVEGRLHLDEWEDKTTGQKRSKLNVIIENFQFTSGGGASNNSEETKNEPKTVKPRQQKPLASKLNDDFDDDVPF
jgi:single-strand DNA-binding protein